MDDFISSQCKILNETDYSVILSEFNYSINQMHHNDKAMAKVAEKVKIIEGNMYCSLPFCHTVEGEALGANIAFRNDSYGPRGKNYIFTNLSELLEASFDINNTRVKTVVNACKILIKEGHNVSVNVSGPFMIINLLIDPVKVYKGFRKEAETIVLIMNKIKQHLLDYIKILIDIGVSIISYGDASGDYAILGPKIYNKQLANFTLPFLKEAEYILRDKGVMVLCPKVASCLIKSDKMYSEYIKVNSNTYDKAIYESLTKCTFISEACSKNKKHKIKNNQLKTLSFKGRSNA